jgi:hypothetical protein
MAVSLASFDINQNNHEGRGERKVRGSVTVSWIALPQQASDEERENTGILALLKLTSMKSHTLNKT